MGGKKRANGRQGPIDIPHPTVGTIDPFPMGGYNYLLYSQRSIEAQRNTSICMITPLLVQPTRDHRCQADPNELPVIEHGRSSKQQIA